MLNCCIMSVLICKNNKQQLTRDHSGLLFEDVIIISLCLFIAFTSYIALHLSFNLSHIYVAIYASRHAVLL